MERIVKVLTLSGLACLLMACNETGNAPGTISGQQNLNSQAQKTYIEATRVKRVVAGRNILGEPTVSMVLRTNSRYTFEVTLLRANIQAGYSVYSERFSHPEVLLSTNLHGNRFLQSDVHPTAVSLKIDALTDQEAVIYLAGTLVNPDTGGYLTVLPSVFSVQGPYLKELLAGQ
ncbi:hypothetical protein [Pseudomonas zeae]|uniref:hypothetical protein n=1 Tax=Pseudomonas zeae TaxID=2745510 RepID=UPI0039DF93A7